MPSSCEAMSGGDETAQSRFAGLGSLCREVRTLKDQMSCLAASVQSLNTKGGAYEGKAVPWFPCEDGGAVDDITAQQAPEERVLQRLPENKMEEIIRKLGSRLQHLAVEVRMVKEPMRAEMTSLKDRISVVETALESADSLWSTRGSEATLAVLSSNLPKEGSPLSVRGTTTPSRRVVNTPQSLSKRLPAHHNQQGMGQDDACSERAEYTSGYLASSSSSRTSLLHLQQIPIGGNNRANQISSTDEIENIRQRMEQLEDRFNSKKVTRHSEMSNQIEKLSEIMRSTQRDICNIQGAMGNKADEARVDGWQESVKDLFEAGVLSQRYCYDVEALAHAAFQTLEDRLEPLATQQAELTDNVNNLSRQLQDKTLEATATAQDNPLLLSSRGDLDSMKMALQALKVNQETTTESLDDLKSRFHEHIGNWNAEDSRLERQWKKTHREEATALQEKLAAYQRSTSDEIYMLREHLESSMDNVVANRSLLNSKLLSVSSMAAMIREELNALTSRVTEGSTHIRTVLADTQQMLLSRLSLEPHLEDGAEDTKIQPKPEALKDLRELLERHVQSQVKTRFLQVQDVVMSKLEEELANSAHSRDLLQEHPCSSNNYQRGDSATIQLKILEKNLDEVKESAVSRDKEQATVLEEMNKKMEYLDRQAPEALQSVVAQVNSNQQNLVTRISGIQDRQDELRSRLDCQTCAPLNASFSTLDKEKVNKLASMIKRLVAVCESNETQHISLSYRLEDLQRRFFEELKFLADNLKVFCFLSLKLKKISFFQNCNRGSLTTKRELQDVESHLKLIRTEWKTAIEKVREDVESLARGSDSSNNNGLGVSTEPCPSAQAGVERSTRRFTSSERRSRSRGVETPAPSQQPGRVGSRSSSMKPRKSEEVD